MASSSTIDLSPAPVSDRPISGALIALLLLGGLGATFLLPRVQGSGGLQWAFGGAICVLATWVGLLRLSGKSLGVQLWLRTPHYVQGSVQGGVYVYWAFYWPQVAAQLPLIAAQVLFLMLFEACISWTRGRQFRLGFSAVPIIGSTNLFLWFRDDVFVWQLVMVAAAYLSKEFIKWNRAGPDGTLKRAHIFNPSAIVLAIAGLAMIVSQTAHLSWAAEISTALGRGPYAYGSIFLMGLIVLSFVPSVLVTLSATVTFMALGAIFFWMTGLYRFVDTTVPIAVWLGLTLLATDPASTPRRGLGKVMFGVLYAGSVFLIYGLLRSIERPPTPGDPGLHVSYFDKLLFLPVLNLSVRWIDRLADWLTPRLSRIYPKLLMNPRLHLVVWVGVFFWVRPYLVDHPGRDLAFWEAACDPADPSSAACAELVDRYRHDCVVVGVPEACLNAGAQLEGTAGDAVSMYARGCAAGMGAACVQTARLARTPQERRGAATRGCALKDAAACAGLGVLAMTDLRAGAFDRAAPALDAACQGGLAAACANLGMMHMRGDGVPRDPARGEALRIQACQQGFRPACARPR
ncbi:MAG: hypothetical protein ACI9U2_002879 [Bradymonadia bacterium]